ncbi:hypothetical protein [Streptomyces noursei]|uniref:golvesin C-terminal-like domain-containing protein n=1 Tax=Streptomyces noursei TaxID=1971 RepID=UPI0030F3236D
MRHRFTRLRAPVAAAAATAIFTSLLQTTTWAADTTPPEGPEPDRPSVVQNADRDAVLGKDWHKSQDRAWTTSSDAQGFHVLVADQKDAYNWRTAATLREPGFDSDMWIGNACVTGSGKRAVVAYAPRTFTNNPELMARGAFTAVVDLDSGDVRKLNRQASLAYFSPGCGTGETAVFTQAGGEDKNATRLIEVDAQAAKMRTPIELEGQVTSAVPVGTDIVAADANRLVKITTSGQRSTIAHTEQIPFQLKADAEGGVVYMDRPKAKAGLSPMLRSTAPAPAPTAGEAQGEVRRVGTQDITAADAKKTKSALLAHGPLAKMDVSSSANGTVFITGQTQPGQALPAPVKRRTDVPKESLASTRGEALVTKTAWSDGKDSRITPQEAAAPRPADVDLKVLDTGKQAEFRVTPEEHGTKGADRSPALAAPAGAKSADAKQATFRATAASGSLDDTAEPQRYCAVPRNDPRKQAMQPKPRQVEWAVDQAITNNLNKHISRPANWKNLGMGAYQPQSLFPLLQLAGGGRIPAQVMLGVTAQESNMWQASRVVVPGVTGNPLVGNFYGIKYAASGEQSDPWGIRWDKADCGYGITQVTDGMRVRGKDKPDEPLMTKLQQEAAALDYTANIAAGVNILADKWNQTYKDGLTVNGGNPKYMESWFFALWAYNSGYYPKSEAGKNGGKWGVGFTNNPANPLWKANRLPFLESASGGDNYKDAAHPQDWPYQEKVLGWAARPLEALESPGKMVHGFRAAWWTSNPWRTKVKPPENLFCTADNECDPSKIGPDDKNEPGLGACTRGDLKCWWNKPVKWKDCDKGSCGNELLRFNDTYKEEADGTAYPPNCTTNALPGNALVVDDVPDGTPVARPGCSQPKKNSGTFRLGFATDSARIDFQQLGAGYGSHFWFAHTRKDDAQGRRMKVTGTWNFNEKVTGPAKVLVHLPDHGAQAKYAKYEIDTAKGKRTRIVDQKSQGGEGKNRWVSIGAFLFDGNPKVTLSTITPDGTGDQDIAFDAVAVAPIKGKYAEHSVEAVAVFDENQNIDGDTASSWIVDSPFNTRKSLYDWGLGLASHVTNLKECSGSAYDPTCIGTNSKRAMQRWKDQITQAGTDPVKHPDGNSLARWIGFANSYKDRPTSAAKPSHFDSDDNSYKIKSKATVSFVVGEDGKIIDGSENAVYEHRTGNTHLPRYLLEMFDALQKDYGIAPPDLSYTTEDLNAHNGQKTTAHPNTTGVLPGRAYAYAGRTPALTDDNSCVAALYTSGGSIGYRPMIGAKAAPKAMDDWQKRVVVSNKVPLPMVKVVTETFQALFNTGGLTGVATGSVFGQAPPIWQELNFKVCANGSVKKNSERPLLRYSHMPDQYLYHNGQAMGLDGGPSNSKEPVNKGDFERFSRIPDPNDNFPLWANPFGSCGAATGKSGNPWDITSLPPASAGTNPGKAHFCLDKNLDSSPDYSSYLLLKKGLGW